MRQEVSPSASSGVSESIIPAPRMIHSDQRQSVDAKIHGRWLEASPGSSTAQVHPYRDEFRAAWDEYVHSHPSASVFHLTAWKRVVEKAFKFEARYLFAEENGRICGVLPLFMVSNILFGRSLISTPGAVYGGLCADDERAATLLRQAACEMAERERVQYLEMREQWPVKAEGFHTKELYVTFDLELPRSVDELLSGFPRDTRYMIRKAQKNGLQSLIDNGQIDTFYEIYSRSFYHLGTPVFSKRLFRIVLDEFGDQCELTTVWRGQKALAAVLSFRFRDGIFPYFGGSLVESRALAANNFMYAEVMRRALEAGVRFFDFGRSKLGSGSHAFKTTWNMRERPLPYQFFLVRRKTMPNFSPANPKFKLAISLWKSLPLPVTRILGPAMVKSFP
jgi:FemAB-related protein (PEP-CTERM system-associated)